jgi:beta-glucosidase
MNPRLSAGSRSIAVVAGAGLLCATLAAHPASAMAQAVGARSAVAALDARVDSLLGRMTLEEKAGQLTLLGGDHAGFEALVKAGEVGATGGVQPDALEFTRRVQRLALQSRLHIPILFCGDVVHGYRTVFPVPMAVASSWDPGLLRQMDSVSAVEATAAGVTWTFAPMVDIGRDPRWGRVLEGAGEDPLLGAAMADAAVHGFQGNSLANPRTMLATAKHFAAYGAVEAGRDYNSVDVSDRRFREVYLPPFKAAVDAGVGSIMAAFVSLNGVPATGNRYLLKDILGHEWGFGGILVSDYDAVPELEQHGFAADSADAARKAMLAGVDVDLHSGTYLATLPALVKAGTVPQAALDSAVRRVLRAKFALGLFDDPFRYGDSSVSQDQLLARHRPIARAIARQSMVLLRNEGHLLPLRKTIRSLAVLGPLADARGDLLGAMAAVGRDSEVVSVLHGIREAVSPGTRVRFAAGAGVTDSSTAGFAGALAAARQADAVVMVVGESTGMSGEGDSRADLGLPGVQLELVQEVVRTGKPVVVVLMGGRPLVIPWLAGHVPAILEAWLPGTEGGHAVADILFGDHNPSARLPMTFPRSVGQIPIYYAHESTGRPFNPRDKYTTRYIDLPNTPLYPFGYGLSYSAFSYAPLRLSTDRLGWNDTLDLSVDVTNTADRSGTEVVQLYLHDRVAGMSPPVKQLKGFRRVALKAGETRKVTFRISRADLAFLHADGQLAAEAGEFDLQVGGNSAEGQSGSFSLLGP